MAAIASEINSISHLKPKPKTAVNGRCQFEDYGVAVPYDFAKGALSSAIMAKLRPLLAEATRVRMVSLQFYYFKTKFVEE